MGKVILYIATSLDGYIAKPDGNLDWLTSIPTPENGDYGYADLLESIGTTIMGRKTYDEVIGFGVDWPYVGLDTYVVTHDNNFLAQSPNTYPISGHLKGFIAALKAKSEKDIWLIGGGHLIREFLNDDLLDSMIITIIPKLIGGGIPLFAPGTKESNWKLRTAQPFNTGVVNLTYDKAR